MLHISNNQQANFVLATEGKLECLTATKLAGPKDSRMGNTPNSEKMPSAQPSDVFFKAWLPKPTIYDSGSQSQDLVFWIQALDIVSFPIKTFHLNPNSSLGEQ